MFISLCLCFLCSCFRYDGMYKNWVNLVDLMQALYSEAIAMVEEHQQAVLVANVGGTLDFPDSYLQLGLKKSTQVPRSCN